MAWRREPKRVRKKNASIDEDKFLGARRATTSPPPQSPFPTACTVLCLTWMPAKLLGRPASSRLAAIERAQTASRAWAEVADASPRHAAQASPGRRPAAARPRRSRSAPRAAVLGAKEWRRAA